MGFKSFLVQLQETWMIRDQIRDDCDRCDHCHTDSWERFLVHSRRLVSVPETSPRAHCRPSSAYRVDCMSLSTDDEGPHSPQRVPGQPLQRSSSSFFGAIRSFVAAPLNWLNSEQVRDAGEKRSFPASVASDERATKKQRRLSPARESQPPSSPSFDEARDGISKLSFQQRNGHTPIPEPPPASLSRSSTVIMNADAEASGSSFAQQWSSTHGPRSLSRDVSMGALPSSQRRSVSRSSLIATPSSPYRMRQSLTPQPVLPPLSPNKRDNHASRASLMWPSASRASLSPVREFRREVRLPCAFLVFIS
jgi:hypothetical protein